jgi:hypothetical protein
MDRTEVLALELRQYEGQGLKTLVPFIYGQTQEARQAKGIPSSLSEEQMSELLDAKEPDLSHSLRTLSRS